MRKNYHQLEYIPIELFKIVKHSTRLILTDEVNGCVFFCTSEIYYKSSIRIRLIVLHILNHCITVINPQKDGINSPNIQFK